MLQHWTTVQPDRRLAPQEISYWKCCLCGLVGRKPLPDEGELRDYYEKSWQFSEPRPTICFMAAAEFISRAAHSWTSGSAIDVGSKGRGLLEEVGRLMPIRSITTIDAAPTAPGVDRAWLGSGYESRDRCDLVVATHVLEHSISPHIFMSDVQRMLTPGGFLYIEVPSQEIGHMDVSICDDVNPNHLWHFTLSSLVELAKRTGLEVVSVRSDRLAPGWPCNRLLARNVSVDGFRATADMEEVRYKLASSRIAMEWKAGDALYGASFSCWRLLQRAGSRPVYDLHRAGQSISGVVILSPEKMVENNVRRVWLTPRFWNSQVEIKRWLNEHYPTIEVLSPYD